MNARIALKLRLLLPLLDMVVAGTLPVRAQQKGQYLPGQFGLNAGILPGPGFTYTNMEINYNTDTFKYPVQVVTVG